MRMLRQTTGSRWGPASDRSPWSRCRGQLMLGLLGACVGFVTPGRLCHAQHGTGVVDIDASGFHFPPELPAMPLTVQPYALVLGTKNPAAGEYALDSLDAFKVYVPPACAGPRRCPLVVFLHGAGETSEDNVGYWRAVSDHYGQILLAPQSDGPFGYWQRPTAQADHQHLDAALRQVFTKFAIDSARVAIIGYSASGGAAMAFGGERLDLFRRVILGSSDFSINTVDPANTTAQFLLTASIEEARDCFNQVKALRAAGHPVKIVIGLRDHGSWAWDWDLMGHWLTESWAMPDPATRPAPQVVTRVLPRVTPEVVRKMTAFWTQFRKEPDSIRTAARLAHLREVVVPVGAERPTVLMTDMRLLAKQFPSVAADLEAAGLTAQQHEEYRVALVSARIANYAVHGPVASGPHHDPTYGKILDSLDRYDSRGPSPITIDPASVQGENLAFMAAQPELFKGLRPMWYTP